jgi:hypothetical protein
MEHKQAAVRKARGAAEAYKLSLELEIWPVDHPRPSVPTLCRAANISMQEFQFISPNPFDIHHRFNFAVMFPRPAKGERKSLFAGTARIFRRTQVSTLAAECYVLEAKIEQIQSMWNGEEKSPPNRKKAC